MSQREPGYHTHPRDVRGTPIFGIKLEPGDVIEEDDIYGSSNGCWEKATCPGVKLGDGAAATWIRPMPIPPERELVRVGEVLVERGSLPPEPVTQDDQSRST